MKTKSLSGGVLVYDRYYTSKPNTVLLTLKKIFICWALSVCAMMYILTEYGFDVKTSLFGFELPFAPLITTAFSVGFSLLFVFVRKRIAIPVMLLCLGFYVWQNDYMELWKSFSYFVDEAMLLVDGRFLQPHGYLLHDINRLTQHNPFYTGGMMMGCAVLCGLFALVCAAALSRRPRVLPPLLLFVALCVPRIIAETLEFNMWLLPTVALFAAAAAASSGYSGGLALNCRKAVSNDENSFLRKAKKASYIKRVEMYSGYYSKYFAVTMYCAAVFAVTMGVSAAFLGTGSGIDYSSVYKFFTNIGSEAGISGSPFEDGPVSEYFSTPSNTDVSNELNITSPGTGEQEIISVIYNGSSPLYLRGDIGIDFTGTSWVSPVMSEPQKWNELSLKEEYRPCEMRVAHSLLETMGYDAESVISTSDVTINYLCDSSVVFLPPYTAEFSYFDNERFNVYGDVVVRVNESFGSINTVQCTSLIPSYTNTDSSSYGAEDIAFIEKCFENSFCTLDSIYTSVVPEMAGTEEVFDRYGQYVSDVYTDVPDELSEQLREYIESVGLLDEINSLITATRISYRDNSSEMIERYASAYAVANYLRENYTYSLTASNEPTDPVMSFLNETKSGHCSLYATAMTLIMRELGIPARYCTGFVVDPNSTGGNVVLKAKNLHAWCEVYIGELGWVTFDPTSSSIYSTGNNTGVGEKPNESPSPEHEESEDTPVSKPEISDKPPRPDISSASESISDDTVEDTTEDNGYKADITRVLPYAALCVGVVVAAAAAALLAYKYYELKKRARQALRMLKGGAPEAAAAEIYRILLELMEVCGFIPSGGELPGQFYRRADERFGTVLSEHTKLLEALAFGHYAAAEDERGFLVRQLEILYARAEKSVGIIRRIKMRRILRDSK